MGTEGANENFIYFMMFNEKIRWQRRHGKFNDFPAV
jgi:hypothetical protein